MGTRDSFWGDMFDEMYNPNGKYPNLGTESLISSSGYRQL